MRASENPNLFHQYAFATFRQAMLEAIARQPALARLTTRESDDYAITLLELWAAVGDVLTFYQERIANESFLRTAVYRGFHESRGLTAPDVIPA